MTVVLPAVADPTVTIVLVTYGQWDLCRRALEAVVEHTDPVYEVVVVDNASPDGTADRLRDEVVGATIVVNDENIGFAGAANQGALLARGRYLCFLNSDAFVDAGWLPPLLAALDGDDGVAAVTPRFLNLDGALQEAGSLLDHSAVTHALGYGDDPDRTDYGFTRTLDYGSGACLLLRSRDFAAVGGFDPVYGRGYYEDVDLGLALAANGRRVVYEPRSTVHHVRGGSGVFDTSTMDLVARNRSTFRARWADEIKSRPCLESLDRHPHRLAAARDFTSVERFLVIDDDAGRNATLAEELLRLWPEARVTLLHAQPAASLDRRSALLGRGVEVVDGDGDWRAWLELRRFHYSAVVLGSAEDHQRHDAALTATQPQALRVLHLAGRVSSRLDGQAAVGLSAIAGARARADAVAAREAEIAAVRATDVVLCASEADTRFVAGVAPSTPAYVLFPAVEPAPGPGWAARDGIVLLGDFRGGRHSPDEDAAVHLVRDVAPGLWALGPDVAVRIAGPAPSLTVRDLAGPRVHVDDSGGLGAARVHVLPLRYGASPIASLVRTMAAGVPFVTTALGALGLGLGDLSPLLVADHPAELAHLAWALHAQQELWEEVRQRLLALVAERFHGTQRDMTMLRAMSHLGTAPPVSGLERRVARQ